MEMFCRKIKFLPIDLRKSHSSKFLVEEDGIRIPFAAVSGLGSIVAIGIYNAMQEGSVKTIADLRFKAGIGDSVVEILRKYNCLDGMPESNQMSWI
jgi:DNA polymerase-3 subunit alpha (Gram-positive type)